MAATTVISNAIKLHVRDLVKSNIFYSPQGAKTILGCIDSHYITNNTLSHSKYCTIHSRYHIPFSERASLDSPSIGTICAYVLKHSVLFTYFENITSSVIMSRICSINTLNSKVNVGAELMVILFALCGVSAIPDSEYTNFAFISLCIKQCFDRRNDSLYNVFTICHNMLSDFINLELNLSNSVSITETLHVDYYKQIYDVMVHYALFRHYHDSSVLRPEASDVAWVMNYELSQIWAVLPVNGDLFTRVKYNIYLNNFFSIYADLWVGHYIPSEYAISELHRLARLFVNLWDNGVHLTISYIRDVLRRDLLRSSQRDLINLSDTTLQILTEFSNSNYFRHTSILTFDQYNSFINEAVSTAPIREIDAHHSRVFDRIGMVSFEPYTLINDEECMICLDSEDKVNCVISKCGHYFHSVCIFTWLEQRSNCPTCRRSV